MAATNSLTSKHTSQVTSVCVQSSWRKEFTGHTVIVKASDQQHRRPLILIHHCFDPSTVYRNMDDIEPFMGLFVQQKIALDHKKGARRGKKQ